MDKTVDLVTTGTTISSGNYAKTVTINFPNTAVTLNKYVEAGEVVTLTTYLEGNESDGTLQMNGNSMSATKTAP